MWMSKLKKRWGDRNCIPSLHFQNLSFNRATKHKNSMEFSHFRKKRPDPGYFHPTKQALCLLREEMKWGAADNWKLLKELEKAAKVYWSAKDRLPPRTVKIDINIETDLAYALKVKECPQLLFLKGNKILYREKESRTSDELVHMIAHFYYNAKRPSWIDPTAVVPPF